PPSDLVLAGLDRESLRDGVVGSSRATSKKLLQQYTEGGGKLLVCPVCFSARELEESALVQNARLAGPRPLGVGRLGRYSLQLLIEEGPNGSRDRYRRRNAQERNQKDLRARLERARGRLRFSHRARLGRGSRVSGGARQCSRARC